MSDFDAVEDRPSDGWALFGGVQPFLSLDNGNTQDPAIRTTDCTTHNNGFLNPAFALAPVAETRPQHIVPPSSSQVVTEWPGLGAPWTLADPLWKLLLHPMGVPVPSDIIPQDPAERVAPCHPILGLDAMSTVTEMAAHHAEAQCLPIVGLPGVPSPSTQPGFDSNEMRSLPLVSDSPITSNNSAPSAVCQWDGGCGRSLADLSPGGIQRHLRRYHLPSTGKRRDGLANGIAEASHVTARSWPVALAGT
ncbi:hypothetical protein BKA93DRAFT_355788 [Sparassis latifolia]